MALHVTDHRKGFRQGLTEITRFQDPGEPTGLSFGVLKLAAGETSEIETKHETAWLLIQGSAEVTAGNQTRQFARKSLFDESPSCLHVAASERSGKALNHLAVEADPERPARGGATSARLQTTVGASVFDHTSALTVRRLSSS